MRASLAVLLLAAACSGGRKRGDAVVVPPALTEDVVDLDAAPGPTVVTPGRWEGGGLGVYVPPGWSGVEGPPPRLMAVRNETTGVELALWAFPEALDGPRDEPGQTCDFVDRGAWRDVPALGLSHTATCADDQRTRQVWWATVDAREVHVEVVTPRGRHVRGRQDTAPMLQDLVRTGPSASGG